MFDFRCCCCGEPMGVTLRCTSRGHAEGKSGMASVKVPCPNCHEIIQLFFTPEDGVLHEVTADRQVVLMPEPSYN